MNIKIITPDIKTLLGALLAIVMLVSCNNLKHLPANDALYTGAKINIEKSSASAKEDKAIISSLKGLVRPKPNATVLGLRIKLSIWNLSKGYDTAKPKGLKKILRKWGEPPVLLSQVNLAKNEKVLTNHLENRGFFHAQTTGDTTVKNRKATATYTVVTGPQYKINEVTFPSDSTKLGAAIREISGKTILKKGEPFNLDVIKGERVRIDVYVKEQGYFYFNPDNLIIFVDSTIGNNLVNLYVNVKPETPEVSREPYTINDVYIYSNYNLNARGTDTLGVDTISYKGYRVIDSKNTFKPAVFDRVMRFEPGDIYNRTDHNLSLSRLINLSAFKFVKNRFQPVEDTFKLDAFYYLTPLPKKSLSADVGAISKSNNANGTELNIRWRNRNAFRGAELLTLSGYFGTDVQVSSSLSGVSTFRTGAEGNILWPRIVFPIFSFNTNSAYVPKSNLQIGYDIINRRTQKESLYSLNQFRGQFGYIWKGSVHTEHTFNPISINYVQPLNIGKDYRDSMISTPEFRKVVDTQFIIGSNYNFNYNQLANKEPNASGLYFNGSVDLSGNLIGLITGARQDNPKELFGTRFTQYIKTELDARYYLKVGAAHQWANRIIFGMGIPHGQTRELPYVKQFFIGGSNSLRGFRSRSIGPGTYYAGQKVGKGGFFPEQTGDVKFEMNSEFRAKLASIFSGAVFIDAGNIWLYNESATQTGAKFSKDFLKQLAVDVGVGLRIDLTILLLRLDLATPIRKPWLKDPSQGFDLSNKENLVLNLAIGLPF